LGELLTFARGGKIEIGEWCFVGEGTRIWSALEIIIGDRVLIGHNVNIFDNLTHPIQPGMRHMQYRILSTIGRVREEGLEEQPIYIGANAWIGANSTILRGVTIGEASIVGTGSVVTRSIPPYTIAAGNPTRIIRELTPSERDLGADAHLSMTEYTRPG
jgi:acetyltransferase-like isoleucine patch superfamily enzyme